MTGKRFWKLVSVKGPDTRVHEISPLPKNLRIRLQLGIDTLKLCNEKLPFVCLLIVTSQDKPLCPSGQLHRSTNKAFPNPASFSLVTSRERSLMLYNQRRNLVMFLRIPGYNFINTEALFTEGAE